jgi:bifunctional non-homologous end joining protein LigD
MLATSASGRVLGGGWAYEPKLDGWRAMVVVEAGAVKVRTRTGRDVSDSLPELAALPATLQDRSVVLDGELVAGAGKPEDFYGIAGRMASRRRRIPLTFVAFDVLFVDGQTVCDRPYDERRDTLEQLELKSANWAAVPSFDGEAADVFVACAELGLEGLVAKRVESRYRPGQRSRDWVKLKTTSWREHHAHRRHEHVPSRSR